MFSQKGFAPILLILIILAAFLVGGSVYYFINLRSRYEAVVPESTPQPLPTQSPTLTPSSKPVSSPSSNTKTITYKLPGGWATLNDKTGKIQIGYDPANEDTRVKDLVIDIIGKWQANPAKKLGLDYSVSLVSYDGTPRHQFLYKELGVSANQTNWKGNNFNELEYTYNGWSCLAFYNVSISQFPVSWVVCPISSSQALLVTTGVDKPTTEQVLGTVKLLN